LKLARTIGEIDGNDCEVSGVAGAQDKVPLFINLTSDDAHRASMGLMFSKNLLERGRKLTVFLNERAISDLVVNRPTRH
jgi:hypothetical protein